MKHFDTKMTSVLSSEQLKRIHAAAILLHHPCFSLAHHEIKLYPCRPSAREVKTRRRLMKMKYNYYRAKFWCTSVTPFKHSQVTCFAVALFPHRVEYLDEANWSNVLGIFRTESYRIDVLRSKKSVDSL